MTLWISTNPTRTVNWALSASCCMRANSMAIAWGITPCVARPWEKALPMVYVLPEPVCPYASTVALYPLNSPSTRGSTHCWNSFPGGEASRPKTWSKVKLWLVGVDTCGGTGQAMWVHQACLPGLVQRSAGFLIQGAGGVGSGGPARTCGCPGVVTRHSWQPWMASLSTSGRT